nr:hypothetical protein [Tanacetum cinerariifolium]
MHLKLSYTSEEIAASCAGSYEKSKHILTLTPEFNRGICSYALHPELPRLEDRIVDLPEGKVGVYAKFFEFANFRLPLSEKYPAVLHQALGLSQKLEQPLLLGRREGVLHCRRLALECSKRWDVGRDYIFHRSRENTGYTPHPHQKQPEALLCLVGLSRRYYLGDEVYHTFLHDDDREDQGTMVPEVPLPEDVPTTRGAPEAGQAERALPQIPLAIKERRKRGHDGVDANAPPKVLRRDHVDPRPTGSTHGGKSLGAIELGMRSTRPTPVPESTPADVSDPDPLSSKGTVAARDPESKNTSFASVVGSPESIYRPEWVQQPGPIGAMGSQLRLRFEQEVKLLKKSVAQVARRDKRIQAREHEIKNLEALLEAKADMKKAAEDKSAKLSQELEDTRTLFSNLQFVELADSAKAEYQTVGQVL